MNDQADIVAVWELERCFWTGDASFHAAHLASEAWMVLPPPAGLMSRAASLQAVASAPRWRRAEFSQETTLTPGDGTVLLVYAVKAVREGQPPYLAWCSSAYLRTPAGWRLAFHQQTPR